MQLLLDFLIALFITTACMPALQHWAATAGLTDRPGARKVHAIPVPRVGGLAMAAGILVPALAAVPLTATVIGFLAGVMVLLLFGVWDDRADLDYRVKFTGQFVAVTLCMMVGHVRIAELTLGSPLQLPQPISDALTFVFLVGVTNAVNLADGLDGLAGGLALLCVCAIGVFGAICGNRSVTALALIESGAILGFLRFNTHPARVFMGDAGSQVLGFSIGVLSVLATQGAHTALSAALPLLLLGLPILDTLTVMIRRSLQGRSPFSSDRGHLHHRLLDLGFAHHEAVVLIYMLQVGLFLLAYFLRFDSDLLIVGVFIVFSAVVLAALHAASRAGWQAHTGQALPLASVLLERLRGPATARHIAEVAAWLMGLGFVLYATTVLALCRHIGSDICILSAVMLIALASSYIAVLRSLGSLERLAAYVGVIMLVYLDQTAVARTPALDWLTWSAVALTAAGALTRIFFSRTRRFEVTALDALVAFVAVVVPNLPGFITLPPDLPGGILKALVLLYVVEMTERSIGVRRRVPRALLAVLLAAVALRGLMPLLP